MTLKIWRSIICQDMRKKAETHSSGETKDCCSWALIWKLELTESLTSSHGEAAICGEQF